MGWKCKNCQFEMSSRDWQGHVVRRQGSWPFEKVWYACPKCGKVVELDTW